MPKPFYLDPAVWQAPGGIPQFSFDCAYCGDRVNSTSGWQLISIATNKPGVRAAIRICPGCLGPNVFGSQDDRYPGIGFGSPVPGLPRDLDSLYEEARSSASAGAYTAAVLVCRKMLMNIAVTEGAAEGKKFIEYVQYLSDKNFVPPNGTAWVDYIRTRGNEATHEINLMTETDAKALIIFLEMLLRFIYEFPKMVPAVGLQTP